MSYFTIKRYIDRFKRCFETTQNIICTSTAARSSRSISQINCSYTELLKKNKISVLEWFGNKPDLNPRENLRNIMNGIQATFKCWEREESNQARLGHWNHPGVLQISGIQHVAVINTKGRHTKYWKIVTLTLLDVIKFQIVLYYAFGEINL